MQVIQGLDLWFCHFRLQRHLVHSVKLPKFTLNVLYLIKTNVIIPSALALNFYATFSLSYNAWLQCSPLPWVLVITNSKWTNQLVAEILSTQIYARKMKTLKKSGEVPTRKLYGYMDTVNNVLIALKAYFSDC